jgi:hypothetical protein
MLLGKRFLAGAAAVALATIGLGGLSTGATASSGGERLVVDEFRLSDAAITTLRDSFVDRIEATYPVGSWAPLRMELDDADLAVMGLPSRAELRAADLSRPVVIPGG